jgi:hypothetical protein
LGFPTDVSTTRIKGQGRQRRDMGVAQGRGASCVASGLCDTCRRGWVYKRGTCMNVVIVRTNPFQPKFRFEMGSRRCLDLFASAIGLGFLCPFYSLGAKRTSVMRLSWAVVLLRAASMASSSSLIRFLITDPAKILLPSN